MANSRKKPGAIIALDNTHTFHPSEREMTIHVERA